MRNVYQSFLNWRKGLTNLIDYKLEKLYGELYRKQTFVSHNKFSRAKQDEVYEELKKIDDLQNEIRRLEERQENTRRGSTSGTLGEDQTGLWSDKGTVR